jgi:hypothetical protein
LNIEHGLLKIIFSSKRKLSLLVTKGDEARLYSKFYLSIMSNKLLGTLALVGAPFLLIGMYTESRYKLLEDSWFTGFWGIIYITAWMCSIVAMEREKLTGDTRFGKAILWIILGSLTVANISNVYQLLTPENKPAFFIIIDLFWPLSNILMLVVGITTIIAKRLEGWRLYIPFMTGLWFPFMIICFTVLGKTPLAMLIAGIYSAITWSLLAFMVRNVDTQVAKPRGEVHAFRAGSYTRLNS